MTISRMTCLAGCAVLVLNAVAWADASPGMSAKPFTPLSPMGGLASNQAPNYLGASIGSPTTDGFCAGVGNCDNSDKSWKVFTGVRMNENLVLEGGYVDFGKQSGTLTGGTLSQQASAFTAAGVVGIPLADQIEAFGKAGVARWTVEQAAAGSTTEDTGTDVLVGIGANYDLGDNMGVRAEWERYKDIGQQDNHGGDIDLMSLGFTFSSL